MIEEISKFKQIVEAMHNFQNIEVQTETKDGLFVCEWMPIEDRGSLRKDILDLCVRLSGLNVRIVDTPKYPVVYKSRNTGKYSITEDTYASKEDFDSHEFTNWDFIMLAK